MEEEVSMKRGRPKKRFRDETISASDLRLKDLGITKKQSWQWQRLASIPEEEFEAILAEEMTDPPRMTTESILRRAKLLKDPPRCGP